MDEGGVALATPGVVINLINAGALRSRRVRVANQWVVAHIRPRAAHSFLADTLAWATRPTGRSFWFAAAGYDADEALVDVDMGYGLSAQVPVLLWPLRRGGLLVLSGGAFDLLPRRAPASNPIDLGLEARRQPAGRLRLPGSERQMQLSESDVRPA